MKKIMTKKNKLEFPIDSSIPTETLDLANGRWYTQRNYKKESDRAYFPSVTTILNVLHKGEGFDRWLGNSLSYKHAMDYANDAAVIGSIVHAYCMRLLWGESIDTKEGFYDNYTDKTYDVGDKVNKRLVGFTKFIEDLDPTVVANEISLFNNVKHEKEYIFPYAGQADQVYKIEDKYILCDIKTGGEYNTHSLQLTAYKLLWDSLYPELAIDEMWGLYLSDSWRTKPYKIKKYNFDPEAWITTYDMWLWSRPDSDKKPKFRKEIQTEFHLKQFTNKENKDDDVQEN